jgi:hypothetical protein
MSTWEIALVRDQGVEFGVICVADNILNDSVRREQVLSWWTMHLQRPVALIGARNHRTYGRQDIVRWLRSVHISQLPWRRMNVAA